MISNAKIFTYQIQILKQITGMYVQCTIIITLTSYSYSYEITRLFSKTLTGMPTSQGFCLTHKAQVIDQQLYLEAAWSYSRCGSESPWLL